MFEEDRIERKLWEKLPLFLFDETLEAALADVERAIALRRARQGNSHPDLIWPLSIKIELLIAKGMPEAVLAVTKVAEERLRLRREALHGVPSEVLASLNEIIHLYTWGDQVHDERRVAELRREAGTLQALVEGPDTDGR